MRQALRKFIKNSTKTGANELRTIYTEERKKCKSLIKDKKSEHKKNVLTSLEQNKHDPKTFWKTIKSATAKVLVQSSITQEEWFNHFSKVFDCDSYGVSDSERSDAIEDIILDEITADDSLEALNTEINCDSLECDITEVEVRDAIQSLKGGKAPGPDGLNGEFYKYSAHCVVAFLTKYFNKLFDSGYHYTGPSRSYIHFIKKVTSTRRTTTGAYPC